MFYTSKKSLQSLSLSYRKPQGHSNLYLQGKNMWKPLTNIFFLLIFKIVRCTKLTACLYGQKR